MGVQQSPNGVILNGGGGGLEPALTHRFVVRFPRLPSEVPPWQENMDYAVARVQPGKKVVEIGQYQLPNRTIQYPLKRGPLPNAGIDLVVFGGQFNGAYDLFWKWFNMVYKEEDGSVGILKDSGTDGIGGTAEIDLVGGPDGAVIATATLENIWPCAFGVGDLARRDDSDAVIASVSLVVNDWTWEYTGGVG